MSKKKFADKAIKASKDLILHRIFLLNANGNRLFPARPKNARVIVDTETSIHEKTPDSIIFKCRFNLAAKAPEATEAILSTTITYLMEYRKKNKRRFYTKELEAFGASGVVFAAWPYHLEMVQKFVGRMDLPNMTLPPVTLGQLIDAAFENSCKP